MALSYPPQPRVSEVISTPSLGSSLEVGGMINFQLVFSGATGSFTLTRKLPGDVAYRSLTYSDGTPFTFTNDVSTTWIEPEPGTSYRWRCDSTSGPVLTRISQGDNS